MTGVETRAATRGDGEVIELDLGITVYPPRDKGGRWPAVWREDGERQQCESVSEDKLAAKLEKVRQRHSQNWSRSGLGTSSCHSAAPEFTRWPVPGR